ncbi:MAG: HAD family hydrolase [Oscillospiraceae bacterium]|nr:HAD family hydrolase [Oscillospiraceae bacterium]
MYQNYLFDLYGTLVDIYTDEQKDSLWQQFCSALAEQGACYRPEELRAAYHSEVRRQEAAVRQTSGVNEPEIYIGPVFCQLLAAKGQTVSDRQIAALAWTFRTLSTEKLRLFDGAEQLLHQLKARGKQVYLLSNAQALFTRPELTALGLADYFDGILLSSEAGVKKPDPHFYRLLMERFHIQPEESLMTGNDDLADCHGAAAVGIDSCYIFTEQSPVRRQPLPDGCREISRILDVLTVG